MDLFVQNIFQPNDIFIKHMINLCKAQSQLHLIMDVAKDDEFHIDSLHMEQVDRGADDNGEKFIMIVVIVVAITIVLS